MRADPSAQIGSGFRPIPLFTAKDRAAALRFDSLLYCIFCYLGPRHFGAGQMLARWGTASLYGFAEVPVAASIVGTDTRNR